MKLAAFNDPTLGFKCRACHIAFLFSEVQLIRFVINSNDNLGDIVFVRTGELLKGGTEETCGMLLVCPKCNTANLSAFAEATAAEVLRQPNQRKLIL